MQKTAWLIGASFASSVAIAQVAPNQTTYEIVSSGVERFYLLHVPAGYDGEASHSNARDLQVITIIPATEGRPKSFSAPRAGLKLVFCL